MTSDSVLLKAAEWHATMKSSERAAARQEEFQRWLEADPANRQAFARIEQKWRNLDSLNAFLGPTEYASSDEALLAVRQFSASKEPLLAHCI